MKLLFISGDKAMNINSLDRFLEAQEHAYAIALEEIKNGMKVSHWIWFIFPQLRGLGRSDIHINMVSMVLKKQKNILLIRCFLQDLQK